VAFLLEEGQEMVVVPVVGKHLQNQGRMSPAAEHGGGEEGPIVAMGHPLPQNPEGAAVGLLGGISQAIQENLDFARIGQVAQDSALGFRQIRIERIFNTHLAFLNFTPSIPFPQVG
jgi:hypothetical protein